MSGPKVGDYYQVSPDVIGKISKILYRDETMCRMHVEILSPLTLRIETLRITLSDLAMRQWRQPTIH